VAFSGKTLKNVLILGFNIALMKKLIGLVFLLSLTFGLIAQKSFTGKAIYYADRYDGRATASGEIFHQSDLTAAHASLPFNTLVKVINPQNNKSVIVTINDRMPAGKGRVIQLSKSAAQKIDMVELGEVKVKVEILGDKSLMYSGKQYNVSENRFLLEMKVPTIPLAGYGIQVASLNDMANLYKALADLSVDWGNNLLVYVDNTSTIPLYKLIIGPFETRVKAEYYQKNMELIYGSKPKWKGFVIDFSELK
jgi:rare lipoprotein A